MTVDISVTPRVLVCGSRDYTDRDKITEYLETLLSRLGDLVLIHGAAPGADSFAGEWAETRRLETEAYPADWDRHGKSAGPIRNQQMLDSGLNLVVAFINKPLDESRGTKHMTSIARKAGVPVLIVKEHDDDNS